jgi:hypothetical protein
MNFLDDLLHLLQALLLQPTPETCSTVLRGTNVISGVRMQFILLPQLLHVSNRQSPFQ